IRVEYHDFVAGDLRTADYVALNPNGMVPLLVDGAFRLWESNAIMQYLADKAGSDALFPRDPQKRADVVRWQFWEVAHFNKAFGLLPSRQLPSRSSSSERQTSRWSRWCGPISRALRLCSSAILEAASTWLARISPLLTTR